MPNYAFVLFYVLYFIICCPFKTNASVKRCQTRNSHGWKAKEIDKEIEESKSFNNFGENIVVVKVYYESLCSPSAHFFTTQLQPAVKALGSRIKVIMNPYGNAETKYSRGSYKFECQHGPEECYGNKLHACAIDIITNDTNAVLYNSCLMKYSQIRKNSRVDFTAVLNRCGNKYKMPIRNCAQSRRGTNLLRYFGQETHKLGIRYVPYVLLDDSSEKQDQATEDLITTICQMLEYPPPVCEMYVDKQSYRTLA